MYTLPENYDDTLTLYSKMILTYAGIEDVEISKQRLVYPHLFSNSRRAIRKNK